MTINPSIPMSGQQIDTATPIQNYNAQQSQQIQDSYNREKLISAQFQNLDAREQSRIRNVSIAAAQVKPFLDRGDVEGAFNYALGRLKNIHSRMGSGENIDADDTTAFLQLLQNGQIDDAKNYVDALVQVGQMTGVLAASKDQSGFTLGYGQRRFDANGNMIAEGPKKPASGENIQSVNPETGEITYTNPAKSMPASVLKQQNEALDFLATANNIKADLGTIIQQLDSGKLQLGPVSNVTSGIQNWVGSSSEQSRNYGTFRATLDKLRNDSLRLNKGVQTEGDAQRAWDELMNNLNDEKYVKQRLQQIQAINQRQAELKMLEVDNLRANYNQPQLDYSKYDKGSALDVNNQQPQNGMQNVFNGNNPSAPVQNGVVDWQQFFGGAR